jgi:NADH-quinone oxidoreductase subunit G
VLEKRVKTQLKVEINGNSYCAEVGETVIQVADKYGIYIPRFCYHKKLSIAANCRMCLVDIENARKPSPACATPVVDGMKVNTKSFKTLSYQKKVMEFLLINHPLDCPICDQGGECNLQDISLGYGSGISKYNERKRTFQNPDLGPLISTNMNRCIQCTRCVRFGEEIAGERELGMMGRGDTSEITTHVKKTVNSELSGNIIDLCPVGALTSKPFQFRARPWELQHHPSISPADSVGANMYVHTRRGQIMRAVPKENETINEMWLADKDRFSYAGVHSENRLQSPMIKKHGKWSSVSWEKALNFVKIAVDKTKKDNAGKAISAIASEALTTESLYLLQKLIRSVGSNSIDTRIKEGSISSNVYTGSGINCSLNDIEQSDTILFIGSFLRKELPLLNHRVYKAQKKGAEVFAINSEKYNFNYPVRNITVNASEILYTLASLLKALHQILKKQFPIKDSFMLESWLESITISEKVSQLAIKIAKAKSPFILVGFDAILNSEFNRIYFLSYVLRELVGSKGGFLSFNANAGGALLAGATPEYGPKGSKVENPGYTANDILCGKANVNLLLLTGIELEKDSILGNSSIESLKNIDTIVYMNAYDNEEARKYADVLLPIATHFETEGSYYNIAGKSQHFNISIPPLYESKPLWKVLRVLGNLLSLEGFDYNTINEVFTEFNALKTYEITQPSVGMLGSKITIIEQESVDILPVISMYRTDSLLRYAYPLQSTLDTTWSQSVRIPMDMAKKYNIDFDASRIEIRLEGKSYFVNVIVDKNLANSTVAIPFELVSPCIRNWSNAQLFQLK